MSNYLIISDKKDAGLKEDARAFVINPRDYIRNVLPEAVQGKKNLKVINLCHNYGYLRAGYYCSLLADARGHRCVPSIDDIVRLNWKRNYQSSLAELNTKIPSDIKDSYKNLQSVSISIFFGRSSAEGFESFARDVFDRYRFPAMKVVISFESGKPEVEEITPIAFDTLNDKDREDFDLSLEQFQGTYWLKRPQARVEKYWLAILHDPQEEFAPSDKAALNKFIKIGKKMDIFVEMITKKDMASLLEFDALFIRETTSVGGHTYRFAQKAEEEGIPVIDDTTSILRCCNKVYQQELLSQNGIPTPQTMFVFRGHKTVPNIIKHDVPVVLKVPDGCFSQGIVKVQGEAAFLEASKELFTRSEVIIAQEFTPSDYDWRILILNGKPLVACKYFMAPNHWQIHSNTTGKSVWGDSQCVRVEDVHFQVINTALKAAKLIGKGLYGVDLKENDQGVFVMEVNDNPNIDSGVEDRLIGDRLYEEILGYFKGRIDA